jgi:hypothetical protein
MPTPTYQNLSPTTAALALKADLDPVTGNVVTSQLPALATESTGTAGAGGLLANRIVYDDAASGTLLYARANALATTVKVRGVVAAAASAAATATVRESGIVAIKGASDIAPVIGADLYLSAEAGGLATTVLTASVVPVLLGHCRSAAVDADGNVLCRLSLDPIRDATKMWTLEVWAPTVNSQIKDFALNPDLWDEIEIEAQNTNANAVAGGWEILRADGSAAVGTYVGVDNNIFKTFSTPLISSSDVATHNLVRFRAGTPHWLAFNEMGRNTTVSAFGSMKFTPPTTSLGVEGRSTNAFIANTSTVTLRGRKKA